MNIFKNSAKLWNSIARLRIFLNLADTLNRCWLYGIDEMLLYFCFLSKIYEMFHLKWNFSERNLGNLSNFSEIMFNECLIFFFLFACKWSIERICWWIIVPRRNEEEENRLRWRDEESSSDNNVSFIDFSSFHRPNLVRKIRSRASLNF